MPLSLPQFLRLTARIALLGLVFATRVQLAPAISRNVPGGSYEITKKLPERDGDMNTG